MNLPTAYDIGFLLASSVIAGFAVFLVSIPAAYAYQRMEKASPKTPKILLMLFCTILGAFIAEIIGYAYLKGAELLVALPTAAEAVLAAVFPIVAGFVIFPIVFLLSYYYEKLEKDNPKTPKVLLMLFCTMLGTLIGEAIIYAYVKYTFIPIAIP